MQTTIRPREETTDCGRDDHRRHRPASGRREIVGLAALAAVLYSMWLSAAWLNPAFDRVANFVSELAADGQPHASLYRSLDIAAGSLLAITALMVLRRHRPALHRAAPFILLIVLGSLTVVDALAPLSCAPSIDLACRAAEQSGQVPLLHRLHTVSSSLVGTVAVAAMAWTWWLTRSRPHATRLRTLGTPLMVAHLVTLAWSLVEIGGHGIGVLGLAQGASLLTLAAWWVVLFLDADTLVTTGSLRRRPSHPTLGRTSATDVVDAVGLRQVRLDASALAPVRCPGRDDDGGSCGTPAATQSRPEPLRPVDDAVAASYGLLASAVVEAGRPPRRRVMDLLIQGTRPPRTPGPGAR